jgi:hypothetical protein
MTLYTLLVLQNPENDIRCEVAGQDKKTGKWAAAANLYHDGFFHTTVVSTQPVVDSPEAAVAFMEETLKEVRKIDLRKERIVPTCK